ncbi:MAG: cyclic nucleotide-binding domain-containing protein [Fibrobacter sp.]|nr:cyclic nucleotide-binding domain-containing protein [Fibrobacter sp.]
MDKKLSFKLLENVLILKKNKLFVNVNTSELRSVAEISEEVCFDNGQHIIEVGERGDSLYLVKLGAVQVFRKSPKTGELVKNTELSEGDYFGEMVMVDEGIREQTVVSAGNSVMLRIGKDDLYTVIHLYPSIGVEFFGRIVKMVNEEKKYLEKLLGRW